MAPTNSEREHVSDFAIHILHVSQWPAEVVYLMSQRVTLRVLDTPSSPLMLCPASTSSLLSLASPFL